MAARRPASPACRCVQRDLHRTPRWRCRSPARAAMARARAGRRRGGRRVRARFGPPVRPQASPSRRPKPVLRARPGRGAAAPTASERPGARRGPPRALGPALGKAARPPPGPDPAPRPPPEWLSWRPALGFHLPRGPCQRPGSRGRAGPEEGAARVPFYLKRSPVGLGPGLRIDVTALKSLNTLLASQPGRLPSAGRKRATYA